MVFTIDAMLRSVWIRRAASAITNDCDDCVTGYIHTLATVM